MDKDRSNNITWEEFKTGIAMSGVRPVPNDVDLRALFATLDADRSGGISFQELSAAFDAHMSSPVPLQLEDNVACSRGFNTRFRGARQRAQ